MRLFSAEHVFSSPWKTLSSAHFIKYPNPVSPHVQSVDVIDQFVNAEGCLVTHRLIHVKQDYPGFMKKIVGDDGFFFHEESIVDPKSKEMSFYSVNINHSSVVTMKETCTYTSNPEPPVDPRPTTLHEHRMATVAAMGATMGKEATKDSLSVQTTVSTQGHEETILDMVEDVVAEVEHVVDEVVAEVELVVDEVVAEVELVVEEVEDKWGAFVSQFATSATPSPSAMMKHHLEHSACKMTQTAEVTSHVFGFLNGVAERFAVGIFEKNAGKGKEVMSSICDTLHLHVLHQKAESLEESLRASSEE